MIGLMFQKITPTTVKKWYWKQGTSWYNDIFIQTQNDESINEVTGSRCD